MVFCLGGPKKVCAEITPTAGRGVAMRRVLARSAVIGDRWFHLAAGVCEYRNFEVLFVQRFLFHFVVC